MPYASQQDMVDRFSEREIVLLTDRSGTADIIDTAVLGQAQTDADAEIDAYLASRYALPLASTPGSIVRIACDITRYRLYEDGAPDIVVERYKAAVRFLEHLANGKVSLGLPAAEQPADVQAAPVHNAPPRVFTRERLQDYSS